MTFSAESDCRFMSFYTF